MSVHAAGVVIDEEASLATRAAWLYFAGGFTQAEIATRLNVPSAKAHRLISRASRDGPDPGLRRRTGGRMLPPRGGDQGSATASPSATSRPISTRPASRSRRSASPARPSCAPHLETGGHEVIGVGHGRTLAAAVAQLPQVVNAKVKFVSLLGGLTRKFSASPFDVIHRLAERTGAEAYVMPVPVFANTASDRRVLLAQIGIADVFDLARSATLMFAGIGEARAAGSLVASGMIRADEVAELERAGVEGEILCHFLDGEGRVVETELSERSISLPVEDLRGRRVVAIAGGPSKTAAIRAVLRSDFLQGLITDEATARRLVGPSPGAKSSRQDKVPHPTGEERHKPSPQRRPKGVKHMTDKAKDFFQTFAAGRMSRRELMEGAGKLGIAGGDRELSCSTPR